MTDSPSDEITAGWQPLRMRTGSGPRASFVALNALIMKRYMFEYGWKSIDFAPFAINAHANAVHNPFARFRNTINEDIFVKSAHDLHPINLMDASPIGDRGSGCRFGAGGIVECPISKNCVAASSAATDSNAIHGRKSPLWLSAAEKSS